MKTQLAVMMALFGGILSAQAEMNFSYEMKYGVGKQVERSASDNPVTSDYSYFENLLDINTYLGDHIYLFTQLEYSNPPVFGYSRTRIDSILNRFYIEYSHERFNVKLGDLYELYGRGLVFYSLQDQNVDYDNSIKGLVLNYSLKENLGISTLVGTREYAYRSNPTAQKNNRQFTHDVMVGSIQYENEIMGSFQYLFNNKRSFFDIELIKSIFESDTELGEEFLNRPDYLDLYLNFLNGTASADTSLLQSHNINWNVFIGSLDIYIDKSWINYDKIYGDEVFGSRFYTSVYTELFGTGITYEYKNYYTPYLIKSISNPPIVYRESNSILASRNVHSMNFGNEIGHQIDLNRNLFGDMNVAANLSFSYRHQKEGMVDLSILDFLTMSENSEIYAYYPFRQMYLEMNGWSLSERLYYKVGVDYFSELNFLNSGKNTYAFTMPTHWVWKFTNGSSVTTYLELQSKTEKSLNPVDFSIANEKNYINQYMSFSYNHFGKWTLTGFYDREIVNDKVHQWPGLDFSFYLNSESQISLFYGSQKGGLICANGIFAEQPGFEDGVKITFRSLF